MARSSSTPARSTSRSMASMPLARTQSQQRTDNRRHPHDISLFTDPSKSPFCRLGLQSPMSPQSMLDALLVLVLTFDENPSPARYCIRTKAFWILPSSCVVGYLALPSCIRRF